MKQTQVWNLIRYRKIARPRALAVRMAAKRGRMGRNAREYGLREKSPRWNGGRFVNARGYIEIYTGGGGYRPEHRLVAEKMLGRPLRKGEVVHHKNEIRSDNRRCNLAVMTIAQHLKEHARMRRSKK